MVVSHFTQLDESIDEINLQHWRDLQDPEYDWKRM